MKTVGYINGYTVIEDKDVTQHDGTYKYRLSFKFPFIRRVERHIPAYMVMADKNIIYCHPKLAHDVMEALKK